jgi:hypothetical protein
VLIPLLLLTSFDVNGQVIDGPIRVARDFRLDEVPVERYDRTELFAFPNLFTNQLFVEIPKEWINAQLRFQVRDILGRLVWQQENTIGMAGPYQMANDLGLLSSGTYLMTVSSKTAVKTLTIQKH